MTIKSGKQKRFEEAYDFRMGCYDTLHKIEDYFSDCNQPIDLKQKALDKLQEFQTAWSDVMLYYKTEWEVEEGIHQAYHPISKLPKTLENANNKLMSRIESLEKEIATLKEGK